MQIEGDEVESLPEHVRAEVDEFFVAAGRLGPREVTALRRERRRNGGSRLTTHQDFLRAVADGTWGSPHSAAARQIRARARAQAAGLAPWPRRASLARVLEDAALAVLSEADPQRPLSDELCGRLREPWQRVIGDSIPAQRRSPGEQPAQ